MEHKEALEIKTPVCFQLNDAFALYKKEKAENDKMLNETNDRLQKQLSELRCSHAKITSQLEFSNKRFLQQHILTFTVAAVVAILRVVVVVLVIVALVGVLVNIF